MKRLLEFISTSEGWQRCKIRRTRPFVAYYTRVGLLWNWRAAWVGVHHSKPGKRTCINLVPFLTIWITMPGGVHP